MNEEVQGFIIKPVVILEDGTMREEGPDNQYPVYPLKDGDVVPTSFELDGKRWELEITINAA